MAKEVAYDQDTVVLKLQFTVRTSELRGFYKERIESEYREMPGSPIACEGFKAGPYMAAFTCLNYAKGSPASVKMDWARITSPAN